MHERKYEVTQPGWKTKRTLFQAFQNQVFRETQNMNIQTSHEDLEIRTEKSEQNKVIDLKPLEGQEKNKPRPSRWNRLPSLEPRISNQIPIRKSPAFPRLQYRFSFITCSLVRMSLSLICICWTFMSNISICFHFFLKKFVFYLLFHRCWSFNFA